MTSLPSVNDFADRVDTHVLRYSRVWEDHRLLDDGLGIGSDAHVLSVASAGCNVLALLLQDPAAITAVDVGSSQLALLALQLAAVPRLTAAELRTLLGVVDGTRADRLALYRKVRPALSLPARRWCDDSAALAEGVAWSGKLERYIHSFTRGALRRFVTEDELRRFLAMTDLEEQRAWFARHLDTAPVEEAFRAAFAPDKIASRGRDPEQFRYVTDEGPGGDMTGWLWSRFKWVCTTLPAADNSYLHAFLLGPDATTWPAPLTDEGHALLQDRVERVELHHGEITALVAERPVGTFSHANLSDIFEYLSPDQTVASLDVLGERMRPGGRIAFWNLFVDRRVPQDHPTLNRLEDLSTKLWDRDRSWFYRAFHVAEVGTRTGGAPPAQRPEPASTATGSGSPTADHAGQEPAAVIPIGASQGDRRSRPRLSATGLGLAVVHDADLPEGGSVLDVSARGLALLVAPAVADALGDELAGARVTGAADGVDRPLPRLRIARRTPASGAVVLGLAIATDLDEADSTAAAATPDLWPLYEGVRSGDLARPASARRPEPGYRPPRIPGRGHYTEESRRERLAWITAETGADTGHLTETTLDAESLTSNIENLVGGVETPVGLAGPLWFNGRHVEGPVTAPLATTEGALVASVCRGATAISRSGGVTTRVIYQRMTRVPMFTFADIDGAVGFARWVEDHIDEVREQVGLVSRHARLLRIDPVIMGRVVHVRFVYETGDAAGQNMTTTCTWRACQWITAARAAAGLPEAEMMIDGNLSGDKKVNMLGLIAGRGTRVVAECRIDRETLADVLKVTPEDMERLWNQMVTGTHQSGMIGSNVNVANTVAAIFTATGQDIASVHESSVGMLSVRCEGDALHATLLLPALIVGTVGGGTALPRQQAYLGLLGCDGGTDRSPRLAEIVAGFALALDLSTLAAVVSGQFADAHERLGRNRPVEWFTPADLSPSLFTPLLRASLDDPGLQVTAVSGTDVDLGSSIITELVSRTAKQKLVGLVPLTLHCTSGEGTERRVDVLVKSKPLDAEIVLMMNQMASMCGGDVASYHARWQRDTGFTHTHLKELELATTDDPRLRRIMPVVHGAHRDDAREAYVLVLEVLDESSGIVLKDTADDVSGWRHEHLATAVRDLAGAHAAWLGRGDELRSAEWMGPLPTAESVTAMRPLWSALAEHGHRELPELVGPAELETFHRLVRETAARWEAFASMPRTLVHNDCNPRNLCLRLDPSTSTGYRLVAYDWELATVHVPQYDVAELLAFTLDGDIDLGLVAELVEGHRRGLETASGQQLPADQWQRGFVLALEDFVVRRLALYVMGHTFRDYRFLERVVATSIRLLDAVSNPAFSNAIAAVDRDLPWLAADANTEEAAR